MAQEITNWEDELHATIPNQLPARLMRKLMMCKGGLANPGSIYYGSGETETVQYNIKNSDDSITTVEYNIPTLKVLEAPEAPESNSQSYQLVCTVTSTGTVSLAWKEIDDAEEIY